ncbi:DUF488 domain-containing protein [Geomonas sp. Red32]|uniref:DUF488 domain-containing protein n=1 Tax=Geomonas sp. Red32 TaxID=2912856 RepID=UPI00202CF390|nr:DUF488 domain-containing protein [Geomonas sp. Red32]MCM0081568.1 DUF488 domain-containing protein [Geomonas sp. Red32]
MVKIKRAYEAPAPEDGVRLLVDRLWPRGLSKERAAVDHWLKDLAPSNELRHWFGHDPARWDEFRERYREELRPVRPAIEEVAGMARRGRVTLLFAARDPDHNNAVVLRELIEELL